jgi:glucose/arabinose dehydrogenase
MSSSTRSPVVRLRAAILSAALLAGLIPGATAASIAPRPMTDGTTVPAAPSSASIALTAIASGLERPVFITSAHDGTGRMFIVEQGGRVLVLKDATVLATPLLDLSSVVSKGGEQGLLGLAFHPSFASNRRFYVNYTNRYGDTVIREYRTSTTSPDRVESGSGRTVLTIDQPYANHNGGMLAFGPDGYLYIATGDGGGAGDPGNRAQSINSLHGKILRINVNGKTSSRGYLVPSSNPYVGRTGLDEIWQRGLRNPWRFSFDRSTGSLWIGDVGQGRYEEVNRANRTSTGAGRGFNWGWRVMEGTECYRPSSGCSTSGKRVPLSQYSHASYGRCSVTGGYVYRGSAIPALAGYYLFGDFCSGEVLAVKADSYTPASRITLRGPGSGRLISSFGEGQDGELYVVDLRGTIFLVEPG